MKILFLVQIHFSPVADCLTVLHRDIDAGGAVDYERESGQISVPEIKEKNGIKVAVIGSGPAGLSFAGDMAKRSR